jgi:hypothetical protein
MQLSFSSTLSVDLFGVPFLRPPVFGKPDGRPPLKGMVMVVAPFSRSGPFQLRCPLHAYAVLPPGDFCVWMLPENCKREARRAGDEGFKVSPPAAN